MNFSVDIRVTATAVPTTCASRVEKNSDWIERLVGGTGRISSIFRLGPRGVDEVTLAREQPKEQCRNTKRVDKHHQRCECNICLVGCAVTFDR